MRPLLSVSLVPFCFSSVLFQFRFVSVPFCFSTTEKKRVLHCDFERLPNVLLLSAKVDLDNELVRHFLIETTKKGVRLKGYNDEPIFGKYLNCNLCFTSPT